VGHHAGPAFRAAGIEPERRIYDLRHTYATFSLAAGVSLFTLSRRMGTSVEIDRTYGHLAPDAEEYERGLLDAFEQDQRGRRRHNEPRIAIALIVTVLTLVGCGQTAEEKAHETRERSSQHGATERARPGPRTRRAGKQAGKMGASRSPSSWAR
jgi:hypothetical protein